MCILSYDNKILTKNIPRPSINIYQKYRVLLTESDTGVRAMIKLYLFSLNKYIKIQENDIFTRTFELAELIRHIELVH